ncbi:MAG: hypothetical protein ACRDN6_00485 [Gaiellaceae bacterium]
MRDQPIQEFGTGLRRRLQRTSSATNRVELAQQRRGGGTSSMPTWSSPASSWATGGGSRRT